MADYLGPEQVHRIDQRTGECSAALDEFIGTYQTLKGRMGTASISVQIARYISRKLGIKYKPEERLTRTDAALLALVDMLVTAVMRLAEGSNRLSDSMGEDSVRILARDLFALNWPGYKFDRLPEHVQEQYVRKAQILAEKGWDRT